MASIDHNSIHPLGVTQSAALEERNARLVRALLATYTYQLVMPPSLPQLLTSLLLPAHSLYSFPPCHIHLPPSPFSTFTPPLLLLFSPSSPSSLLLHLLFPYSSFSPPPPPLSLFSPSSLPLLPLLSPSSPSPLSLFSPSSPHSSLPILYPFLAFSLFLPISSYCTPSPPPSHLPWVGSSHCRGSTVGHSRWVCPQTCVVGCLDARTQHTLHRFNWGRGCPINKVHHQDIQ